MGDVRSTEHGGGPKGQECHRFRTRHLRHAFGLAFTIELFGTSHLGIRAFDAVCRLLVDQVDQDLKKLVIVR